MRIAGTATLAAPRGDVWDALNDPAVLVRTIPGCERLDSIGPDAYRMTISAGVASIKGVYEGQVSLTDQRAPETFVLEASGAGTAGTIMARVVITLAEAGPDTTTLSYEADATVGGMIGGVGQRMLTGVATKTAGEFFAAVDDVLNGRTAPKPASAATEAPPSTTWVAPPRDGDDGAGFAVGVAVGAAAALAGAVVGGLLARRRR